MNIARFKQVITAVGLLWLALGLVAQPVLKVPPGFTVELVAGPPALQFPMFATLDDAGRLYVTESSGNDLYAELLKLVRECRISWLEDRDGDGRYEVARVFAENLTPSMGLVWHDHKLYAADPPDLVTLEDTDGDGRADKRVVVLTGFGHTDNGSLHGLTFGPDGWLYFTTGNPDGYDLRGPDGSRAVGKAGALLRCRPDGSKVEIISRGFENLVEIVFLPDGSMIGTLTWYQIPERGIRDALIQLLEGSQFPLHTSDMPPPDLQLNTTLPAIELFPAVAHSGLEIYRGTAFPSEMRGNLFSAQHNSRKIVRHRLTPKGASYAVENFDFVTTDDPDVHFSDVLEDADGSLLVVDTGSWYVQHCPTGRIRQAPARGGIYRVSYGAAGTRADYLRNKKSASERKAMLDSAQPADWLAQLKTTNAITVAAAARMLSRLSDTNASAPLTELLQAPNLALRLAAVEALAHCGNQKSVPPLIEALAGETDAFLEHAITFALHRLADRAALLSALSHPNPKVQNAALVLLDQPCLQAAPPAEVTARLDAAEPHLRETARWVLLRHPEWGDAGATFLRHLVQLANPTESDRRALERFLPLFQTNVAVLSAIADALSPANQKVTQDHRARLLEALQTFDPRGVPRSIGRAILQILQQPHSPLLFATIRVAGALRVSGAEPALASIAHDVSETDTVRNEALRELVRRHPALAPADLNYLLVQLSSSNSPASRLVAAEILLNARLTPVQMPMFLQTIGHDALISPAAVLASVERTGFDAAYTLPLLDYLAASLDRGWTLSADQLAKVQAAVPEAQRTRAESLLARLSDTMVRQRQQLAEFEPLLKGGDPVRGERLFFEKAQCTTCHRIWENGGRVGPDLTRVGAIRSGHDLLESILLPSATIAQGYDTLIVQTKDGESYTGIRAGKSDDPLVLRDASGHDTRLRQGEIERLEHSKVSLMPEGLLNQLSREEISDLLAYLQHLK